jgi:hypothetical protein
MAVGTAIIRSWASQDRTQRRFIAAPVKRSVATSVRENRPKDRSTSRDLLMRAGVADALPSGTDAITAEPVLVLCGTWRENLRIYDRSGKKIGTAERSEDSYSDVGYRYDYELRDTQLRCVLRDTTRRRFGIDSFTYAFSVLGADGAEIGAIIQSGKSQHGYTIASDGRSIAAVHRVPTHAGQSARSSSAARAAQHLIDRVHGRVWCIEDEPGHDVARITYLPGFKQRVAYVLQLEPCVDASLRTIALTVCLVADNRIINRRPGG